MHASDSLRAPNRITFHDELNAKQGTIQREAHFSKWARPGFAEGLGASAATETLITLRSLPKPLALCLAIVARHFGLAFFGPIEPK
jgi:hypothetical protein